MKKAQGRLTVYANMPGTVAEAVGTLQAIEYAYLMLYATEVHVNSLRNRPYELGPPWWLTFSGFASLPPATGPQGMLAQDHIRRSILLPEDVLQIDAIRFSSEGFWSFLGSLNPLETIRKWVQDHHERKKDNLYRSREEDRGMQIDNAIKNVELLSKTADLFQRLGVSQDEARRALLPAAQSLCDLDDKMDQGLVTRADLGLIRIEDKSDE